MRSYVVTDVRKMFTVLFSYVFMYVYIYMYGFTYIFKLCKYLTKIYI